MTTTTPPRRPVDLRHLIFLAAAVLLVSAVRYRLLGVPLERDEGGFAYMGKLILSGIPPYTAAYDFKPPGLYLMYALFMALFGASGKGIHTGLLVMNAGTMIFLAMIFRRIFTPAAGIATAFLYGTLAVCGSLLGFAAHATHFVVFWMAAGYFLLAGGGKSPSPWRLLAAGGAFSLAALMKQPGALFLMFALALPFLPGRDLPFDLRRSMKSAGLVLGGALIPLVAAAGWLAAAGAFEQFVYWNLQYGIEFGSQVPLGGAWRQLLLAFPPVAGAFVGIWVAAGAGLVLLWFDPQARSVRIQLTLLAACSAAAAALSFVFRSHYFVLTLPAVAALAGYAATSFKGLRSVLAAACALAFLYGGVKNFDYFMNEEPAAISSATYFPNGFAASPEIASYVRGQTSDTDKVAIFGSEPQVLFEAGRESATRYLFMYFFMEKHPKSLAMEHEMAEEVEKAAPKMIVFFNQPFSWGSGPQSETFIFDWANNFIKQHYQLDGAVDLLSPEQTVYKWGHDARLYPRTPAAAILLFRRQR